MNPVDDTFISAGDDGTVRLWDLRAQSCRVSGLFSYVQKRSRPGLTCHEQGQLNDVGGSTIAAFDSGGLVFAVACSDTQTIALYGSQSLDNVGHSQDQHHQGQKC